MGAGWKWGVLPNDSRRQCGASAGALPATLQALAAHAGGIASGAAQVDRAVGRRGGAGRRDSAVAPAAQASTCTPADGHLIQDQRTENKEQRTRLSSRFHA